MSRLDKFSLIILTRCNLRCRLCCEYVPQNKPFPDMTPEEARSILDALFAAVERVGTLHLTGGGEPFLHPELAELVGMAMEYQDRFDRLMLFTNGTVPLPERLVQTLGSYGDKLLVQVSRYGIRPEMEETVLEQLRGTGVRLKVETYYGEQQSFGGWVDFGGWEARSRTPEELERVFRDCAVTRDMRGNWRTRDGKVYWCSRAQRGGELGLLPDADYVNLFDSTSPEEKRRKFEQIAAARYLTACDHCSGDQGTCDAAKRHPAAEQL